MAYGCLFSGFSEPDVPSLTAVSSCDDRGDRGEVPCGNQCETSFRNAWLYLMKRDAEKNDWRREVYLAMNQGSISHSLPVLSCRSVFLRWTSLTHSWTIRVSSRIHRHCYVLDGRWTSDRPLCLVNHCLKCFQAAQKDRDFKMKVTILLVLGFSRNAARWNDKWKLKNPGLEFRAWIDWRLEWLS